MYGHSHSCVILESSSILELLFLGLNIIPVYPIALWADQLVFNSLVWWNISEEPMIKFESEYKPQGELGF